jgi:quercetin dioxygenase-like cupin family protein
MQHKDLGVVIRRDELDYKDDDGVLISRPVGPQIEAQHVSVDVVRIPAGRRWAPPEYTDLELTLAVFAGDGELTVGPSVARAVLGVTGYAPAGVAITCAAGESDEVVLHVWHAPLPEGARRGGRPVLINTVFNQSTGIRQFGGTGEVRPVGDAERAFMNFAHWPGNGCAHLCVNSGMAAPGHTFNIHGHPGAEDALFALQGRGQFYLGDRWIDVGPGDGIFARTGVLHGTRNPDGPQSAPLFVSVGGPVPFDPVLYQAAGLSAEVV